MNETFLVGGRNYVYLCVNVLPRQTSKKAVKWGTNFWQPTSVSPHPYLVFSRKIVCENIQLPTNKFRNKRYTRVSLSRPPLCNSLSERTHYRNVLVIGTICSNNEYTKFLCNVLGIGTALCDLLSERTRYRNVLVIGTYSLSEQFSGTNLYTYKSNDLQIVVFQTMKYSTLGSRYPNCLDTETPLQ